MSKLTKFFIICSAIFVIGIGMAAGGCAAGGTADIDKLADKYDWISGSPGELQVEKTQGLEFDSIEVNGSMEVYIVGLRGLQNGLITDDADDLIDEFGGDINTLYNSTAGDVVIFHGSNVAAPEVKVENGVLKIYGTEQDSGGFELNLTGEGRDPDVLIFCDDKTLNSINVNNPYGDTDIYGVGYGHAAVTSDAGDIEIKGVSGGGLTVSANYGDIELSGTFSGETNVRSETGDIDFETSADRNEFSIYVQTDTGTIEDGDIELDGDNYTQAGGTNILKLESEYGDIEFRFGNAVWQ